MTMLACFICGFYLQGGITLHAQTQAPERYRYEYWRYDITVTRNPYGVIAIGHETAISPRLRFAVEVRHESAIGVNDFGTDSLGISLKWRPW